MRVRIALPFPPSVNALWRIGRSGGGKRFLYKTKAYRSWLQAADIEWLSQKPRGPFKTIDGPFKAQVLLSRPDRRSRDSDNYLKAPLDFAQRVGIISNDCNSLESRAVWVTDEEAPEGMVLIIDPVNS